MDYVIQDPLGIQLSGAAEERVRHAEEALAEFTERGPLSPELVAAIHRELLPVRVVATLNMEGIWVNKRQTLAVMDGIKLQDTEESSEREIANALATHEFIQTQKDRGTKLSVGMIREINRQLLTGIRDDAGQVRSGNVRMSGGGLVPPPGPHVLPLLDELVSLFESSGSLPPIVQAAWLHAQFTYIHPFNDGNGRTGRLLQDWALVRGRFLPTGVRAECRDSYYAALERADAGQWSDLVELIAQEHLWITSKCVAVIKEREKRANWISALASRAAAKTTNSRHKRYERWRYRIETITEKFASAVRELDAYNSTIGAEIKPYSVVDFEQWEKICRWGYVDRSWLFTILFYAEGKPLWKLLAYCKRHVEQGHLDFFEQSQDNVAVYFSGSKPLDKPYVANFADPDVELREVLVLEDGREVIYVQGTDESRRWQLLEDATVGDAVEQVFTQVFSRKGQL